MEGKFVGLVPAQLWLDTCMPCSKKRPASARIDWDQRAVDSVDGFVEAYSKASKSNRRAFGSIVAVSTKDSVMPATKQDPNESKHPNLSFYKRDPRGPPSRKMDWNKVVIFGDRKRKGEDIVAEHPPNATPQERAEHILEDEDNESREQFISYASSVFDSQPLLFYFSLIIIEDEARFIRWDRSGAVVSERFNWVETDILTEFLWRVNRASPGDLGRDTTVSEAAAKDARIARKALQAWSDKHPGFITPPADDAPIWRIEVFDDAVALNAPPKSPDPQPRVFFGTRFYSSTSFTGRATSAYYAVEITPGFTRGKPDTRVVYLKDTWRIDLAGVEKEGNLYRAMEAAGVPNIAGLVCAGDVWGKNAKQRTMTSTIHGDAPPWLCSSMNSQHKLTPHIHYRLVLDTIAKPLCQFDSTWQLCSAVADALEAHQKAFLDAEVLHQDISAGNIMITPLGKGILIDWDLSMGTARDQDGGQEWRMGTWPFMSYALLSSPVDSKTQSLPDDLESFIWVLIYHILCYRPTARRRFYSLKAEIYEIFDRCYSDGDQVMGGYGKDSFLRNLLFSDAQISKSVKKYGFPKPLARLIANMRCTFWSFYAEADDYSTDDHESCDEDEDVERKAQRQARTVAQAAKWEAEKNEATLKLSSHEYLLGEFRSALSNRSLWPERDYALDYLPGVRKSDKPPEPVPSLGKRKRGSEAKTSAPVANKRPKK